LLIQARDDVHRESDDHNIEEKRENATQQTLQQQDGVTIRGRFVTVVIGSIRPGTAGQGNRREWLEIGQRRRRAFDSLRPECRQHRTLACLCNANGRFGDVGRQDPTLMESFP
jgi:hypothetical protein